MDEECDPSCHCCRYGLPCTTYCKRTKIGGHIDTKDEWIQRLRNYTSPDFNLIPSSVPRKQKERDIAAINGDNVDSGSNLSIIANVSTDAMVIVDDAHVEQKDDALMQVGEFDATGEGDDDDNDYDDGDANDDPE